MSQVMKWYYEAIERGEKPDLRSVLVWIYYSLASELEQFSMFAERESQADPSDEKAARWSQIFRQDAQEARDTLARAILAWNENIPPDQLPGSLHEYHGHQSVEINGILHCVFPILGGETVNDFPSSDREQSLVWERLRKQAEEGGDRIMFMQTFIDHTDNRAKI